MSAAQNPLNNCPYWVGDILTTMSKIQPAQRWPGTSWERITDCFLRAADSTHPVGSTGGAWEVVQTVEQMPSHTHAERVQTSDGSNNPLINTAIPGESDGAYSTFSWTRDRHAPISTADTGGNQPMSIVNQYTAVYMYRLTTKGVAA